MHCMNTKIGSRALRLMDFDFMNETAGVGELHGFEQVLVGEMISPCFCI
jgi:hypothetical protein